MAKLLPTSFVPKTKINYDDTDWRDQLDKEWDEIEAEGPIVKFGVADGYAVYIVRSMKPLTLQHVNSGDGYSAHPALIRGLTVADVKRQIDFEAWWKEQAGGAQ
jgi:hypothetical protein